MEVLAAGYQLAEAPTPAPDGSVYFTDALGGGAYRWTDGSLETVVPKRRGMGGLLLHAGGGLVVSGRTVDHIQDGHTRTILDVEAAAGFNDMTTDPSGRVVAGALLFSPFAGEEPVPGEIWRAGPDGETARIGGGLEWPNGMAFSADGRTLYACDYAHAVVRAYDVRDDGLLGDPRTFATAPSGSCDGLALAEDGSVWVALGDGGGVARFTAEGTPIDLLDVGGGFITSLAFGGEGMRDLYVTSSDELRRVRADRPGLPVAAARA